MKICKLSGVMRMKKRGEKERRYYHTFIQLLQLRLLGLRNSAPLKQYKDVTFSFLTFIVLLDLVIISFKFMGRSDQVNIKKKLIKERIYRCVNHLTFCSSLAHT